MKRIVASGLLAATCVLGGCLDTGTRKCSWGVICPPGTVCHEQSRRCVEQVKIDACKNLGQEDLCEYPNSTPGDRCVDGVCESPFCGDGILDDDRGEDCDEGVDNSNEPNQPCRENCRERDCADGVWDDQFEVCDDGNEVSGDGCSADCLSEEYCGNGYVDVAVGESCDNGNTQPEDGCSAACGIEPEWHCEGEPSVCLHVGIAWVQCSAATFQMGSPASELGHQEHEILHSVTLTHDFEIMDSEVTQRAFEVFMGYNPSTYNQSGPDYPAETLTWYEAAAFCNAVSEMFHLDPCYACQDTPPDVTCEPSADFATPYDCPGYRLPTEAEWEYAARAGDPRATYNGNHNANQLACEHPNAVLDPIAWFCGNAGGPNPVQTLTPNAWGLYDMLGNVQEWIHDWESDYVPTGEIDPWGPVSGLYRTIRGGSWYDPGTWVRTAYRDAWEPYDRDEGVGFRVVRTINP